MSTPDIAVATVEIELAGGTITLQPTARALMEISKRFGSMVTAVQQVLTLNADAMVAITRIGGKVGDKRSKGLDEEVFSFGLKLLQPLLLKYLASLNNGGRPAKDDDADEAEAAEGNG